LHFIFFFVVDFGNAVAAALNSNFAADVNLTSQQSLSNIACIQFEIKYMRERR